MFFGYFARCLLDSIVESGVFCAFIIMPLSLLNIAHNLPELVILPHTTPATSVHPEEKIITRSLLKQAIRLISQYEKRIY